LIRDRTQAGLAAARARGRVGGRPAGLSRAAEATALAAETLYREGTLSIRAIAEKLHIAKSTLYVYLRHRGVPIGPSQQASLPADSPQRPRARHPQVGGESLSSYTALGEHRVETLPPAVHALAALESHWAMARSTVLMALWHTEGGTMALHSKVQEPSERRGPLVKTTTRSGRSLII
jgi:Helix-turn-helix domain of resolvase